MYYLRRFTEYPFYCYFNAGFVKIGINPFLQGIKYLRKRHFRLYVYYPVKYQSSFYRSY